MKPLEHRIKRMIERLEIAEHPCADEVNQLIGSAYADGHMCSEDAVKWLERVRDAVRLQKGRLQQRDHLVRSGAVKC